jgi:2-(1,2-epoxy-1,2-dihydrophenyl)acetyl-CoA isomerase
VDLETVNYSVDAGAATIELNRPDKLNAWDLQFAVDLLAAVEAARDDEAVRAVMITGAGRGFSSGADLAEPPEVEGEIPDMGKRLRERYHPILLGIRGMPKPVVAAVNGPAVGIGCSLALACDLIVAAESSYMLLAFVNIGLVPDGGSTAFVPARTGAARAFEMALLGEKVPAAKALEWGLDNRVHPDGELVAVARALTARLASGPTAAYANAKKLLNRRLYPDLEGQLEAEAEAQQEQGATSDFLEGVGAFMQKRPPQFTGR